MPRDGHVFRVCRHLQHTPGDRVTLPELAHAPGTSKRTREHIGANETGLPFGPWRQRPRMQLAVERLAEGGAVTTVALELGYSTVNGFIDAFRSHFSVTPG